MNLEHPRGQNIVLVVWVTLVLVVVAWIVVLGVNR